MLAPIVPIMYLDHVTDAILKGIGEQVYSMWVNIADSLLSVILVCILIPRIGILGYAVVIIIMEAFNFILSFVRLRKKIRFGVPVVKCIILPLFCSCVSAYLTKMLFVMCGSTATALWLVLKLLFALCIFFAIKIPLENLFCWLSKSHIRILNGAKCK